MRFIGIIFCAFAASGAHSQTIVDACERVVSYQFGPSEVHSFDVQAFPKLTPPRVQMRVRGEAPNDYVADALRRALGNAPVTSNNLRDFGLVRCEFESNAPPFGLTEFRCGGERCFGGISDERLEELQVLLQRAYPY